MNTCGLRKKSVLLVDDNHGIQDTVKDIAENLGLLVFRASSRNQALDLVKKQAFDIAIVDKRLVEHDKSNSDGLAILQFIDQLKEHTFKILMTGYGEYGDAVSMQKYSVRAIEKNTDPLKMASILSEILSEAINEPAVGDNIKNPESIFSGENDPSIWMHKANVLLKPKGNINPITDSIGRLVQTCAPLYRCHDFENIIFSDSPCAVFGLYWSRGLGTSCMLTISRDSYLQKDNIPSIPDWEGLITIGSTLFKAKNKNIYFTILSCSGIDHENFNLKC